jgi:hypothetical protein
MGSPKTKTDNRPTPEVLALFNQVKGQYSNPDGSLKTAPRVDPGTAASQQRMDQLVAPQSADTQSAYSAVRAGVGQWQPGMDQARSLIQSSAGPVGQKIDFQGGGWSVGPDGKAVFNWDDAYGKSYNQYTGQVVDNTLSRLSDVYGQQRLRDTHAAINAGSFGGSREAVQRSLTNEMHMRAAAEAAASGYANAHQSALGNIQSLYGMGSGAVGANNALDAANADRARTAGQAIAGLEGQIGQFRAGDANALAAIGKDQQDYEQRRRDALLAEAHSEFYTPLQLATGMAGMMPNTGSSTTSTSGGLLSQVLGAGAQGLGAFLAFSDERAKKDVRDSNPDKALAEIRQLEPKTYAYTDDAISLGAPEGRRTGFMAQDLEAATGEPAPEMAGGYKGVDLMEQIGRLTQAVIALDRKVGAGRSKAA